MTIFLYTGFISTIPRELDEAAMIDGAGRFELFYRILLPLLKPITATVIILSGVAVWNDYQFSVFFLQIRIPERSLSRSPASSDSTNSNIGWVAAGSLMGALPMIVAVLVPAARILSPDLHPVPSKGDNRGAVEMRDLQMKGPFT